MMRQRTSKLFQKMKSWATVCSEAVGFFIFDGVPWCFLLQWLVEHISECSLRVIRGHGGASGAKHSPPSLDPWLTEGMNLASQRDFVKLTDAVWIGYLILFFFWVLQSSTFRNMLKLRISAIELKFGTILNTEFFRTSEKLWPKMMKKWSLRILFPVIPDHVRTLQEPSKHQKQWFRLIPDHKNDER